MKTQLRLNSVIPFGLGSDSESICIDLIYSMLLNRYKQNEYSYITINQIGDDLKEFILQNGKQIHINIRYSLSNNIQHESHERKNIGRLNLIHTALGRIANEKKKLDIRVLEDIKKEILQKKFLFYFVFRCFTNRTKDLRAEIIVHPQISNFQFFIKVFEYDLEKCSLLLYVSKPAINFDSFFSKVRWKNKSKLIITGKEKQVEIHVNIEKCDLKYVNLTKYENPPLFEIMKANISKEDEDTAYKNWIHSLPPAIAALIRKANN